MRALYLYFMMDLYGNVPIITDFPVTRGDAEAFDVRLDEVQDPLLPLGEPWAGAVISPSSVRHSPSPPLETGFRYTYPRSKVIRTQQRHSRG